MKHKISSLQHNITEMYKLFFSVKSTNKDTYEHIAMLFILNMFLHSDILKMRRFSVKDYSGPNSNFFSFYGEEFKKKNINLTKIPERHSFRNLSDQVHINYQTFMVILT